METNSELLARAVASATPALRLTEGNAPCSTPARAWTPRQVLGHLIDSAATTTRFVRAQLHDGLVCQGLRPGGVGRRPAVCRCIVGRAGHAVEQLQPASGEDACGHSNDVMTRPRVEHNLDEVAWRRVRARAGGDPRVARARLHRTPWRITCGRCCLTISRSRSHQGSPANS